jgi:uncharacterized membrane protein YeaQ/YmgE (transglycosylase-associated protein family)
MLEQLFNLVKQFGGDSVINNPEVPNEQNNGVLAEATGTIAGGLQNLISGGGLQGILSLFKGGGGGSSSGGSLGLMKNPIVNMMVGHFASKLMGKFGIKSGIAGNIATSLIPNVLNGLISKTNDPNDSSFSIDGIIRSLTGGGGQASPAQNNAAADSGGGGFDIAGILGKLTGGDRDGDGDTDLQDALAAITGGARQQQQQQSQSGGGIMDMLKGLIGG